MNFTNLKTNKTYTLDEMLATMPKKQQKAVLTSIKNGGTLYEQNNFIMNF